MTWIRISRDCFFLIYWFIGATSRAGPGNKLLSILMLACMASIDNAHMYEETFARVVN
jgi:hypothetical protein